MGVTLKLFMLLVITTFIVARAQRYFDPWGGSAFDNSFGFSDRGLPPCPQYEPMRISNWETMPTGHFLLRGTLPGVRSNGRRVWLDQSGTTLHIQAARRVPARGRRCLPPNARISSDGRHEVYETSVALPRAADAAGGTIQQTSNGIEVLLPLRPEAKQHQPVMPHVEHETRMNPAQKPMHGEKQLRSVNSVAQDPSKTHAIPPQLRESPTRTPKAPHKIPEGVEVNDVEPEEPAKNPNASEGWWDNRGEFQYY